MAVHVLHSVYLEPSWERARTQDDKIINNTASGHILERWKWCWMVSLKAHCDTIFMHLFSHLLGMFLKRLHWLTQSGKALQNSMQKHVETGCLNAPLMLIAPHSVQNAHIFVPYKVNSKFFFTCYIFDCKYLIWILSCWRQKIKTMCFKSF